MPMLVAGLLLLWLSSYLLRGFIKANPAVLSRRLRQAGGYFALAFGLLMMVRGEFNVAFGAALFGFWLLGTQPGWAARVSGMAGRNWSMGNGRRPRVSQVRTPALEMTLNQETGQITGLCTQGPSAGRQLDELSQAECVTFHRWCERTDAPGARLLETYLDRRFAAWREAGHTGYDPGSDTGSRRGEPTQMSEHEAYQVLGLAVGADRDEITRAHRRMMKKYHPDHGGSTAMAARVNEAKAVLFRRHA